jgi:SAM-dependent methyltransferase
MAARIPERLLWAVETLAVEPADRLLEIGCGHGVAVSLVCERLTTGTIVAIDRSTAMIGHAWKRNERHIAAGKATLHVGEISDIDVSDRRFDKVFAVNVSLFWTHPNRELAIVKEVLAPGGGLFVFHHPPVARKATESADLAVARLEQSGFHIDRIIYRDIDAVPAVCVVSHPA